VDAKFAGDSAPAATGLDSTVVEDIYSVTFASGGSKLIPVIIRPGNNKAQVIGRNIFPLLFLLSHKKILLKYRSLFIIDFHFIIPLSRKRDY